MNNLFIVLIISALFIGAIVKIWCNVLINRKLAKEEKLYKENLVYRINLFINSSK